MADDITVKDAADADVVVAGDSIASKLYQRVKLIHGIDGVNDGDVATTNPFPVVDANVGAKADSVATTDTGTFSLIALFKRGLQSLTTIGTNTTGLATAAAQTTAGTSLSSILTATQDAIRRRITTPVSFNRPADTTTYTVLDLVANSTTAGSVTPLTVAAARAADQAGSVIGCILDKTSAIVAGGASFRVHLYNVLPTFTNGDNSAFVTPKAGWLGTLDVLSMQAFSDGARGQGKPTYGAAINFAPVTGTANLYAVIEAQGAYVPTSGETFTLTLEVL